MEYSEAIEFLYSHLPMFSRVGAAAYKPGLDTSINLSRKYGDPHKRFKSIHIGGTNGKGSTSHMLASVLQAQGYKVGLYTSPHLVDFRERMRVNGEMIPEEKVVEFVETLTSNELQNGLLEKSFPLTSDLQPPTSNLQPPTSNLKPSFFELTMQMAFNWFAEEKVDYAVIEVGMGGRLDSTNIISPVLSVITNISHDHNQFLGDTLEKIATEKAGIIKPSTPVVIGETQKESAPVFISKASQENAPITFADQEKNDVKIEETDEGWKVNYNGLQFTLPLGGEYQRKNIVTVISALEALRKLGLTISDEAIKEGIEKVVRQTGLAGRWMILSKSPLTIADTGHNIGGLEYNFGQLERKISQRPGGKLRIVIGFVADKAIDKIMDILPREAKYYVTNASIPRALAAEKLMEKFETKGLLAEKYPDVGSAYEAAKKEASESDIIFIGGSTFIVADLLTFLHYSCGGRDSLTGCC